MKDLRHLLLAGLLSSVVIGQDVQRRYPHQHPDFGLPIIPATWQTYGIEPDHVCNLIWRKLYLTECVPSEVATALPREHGPAQDFFRHDWYFAKRKGELADKRWFGGDGRQLPIEGFEPRDSGQLIKWLKAIDGTLLSELRSRPRSAVWFQHDLLRLAQRLITTNRNPELLQPLWQCAKRLALPKELLRSDALATASINAIAAQIPGFDHPESIEIERQSSRLFNAEFVQLWSSVYLSMPNHSHKEVETWLADGKQRTILPIGSVAVLVQGIVAVDNQETPIATDLVIEARSQRLRNRDPLAYDNLTTTRDGVDFAIWSLPRQAVRDFDETVRAVPFTAFRSIDMESQDLFRDYGTSKHTTYAAQCTLCHRRSNTPDETIAGFSALRVTSKPRRALPGERRQRSESEMLRFLDKLRGM